MQEEEEEDSYQNAQQQKTETRQMSKKKKGAHEPTKLTKKELVAVGAAAARHVFVKVEPVDPDEELPVHGEQSHPLSLTISLSLFFLCHARSMNYPSH